MIVRTLIKSGKYHDPVALFRDTPVGIDVRRVVEKNILPRLNANIAHKLHPYRQEIYDDTTVTDRRVGARRTTPIAR